LIACDVYYNENGNLVFQSGISDIAHISKPTLWSFTDGELEYLDSDVTYNFSNAYNRVIVIGGNVNGTVIYSAISENNNPKSPTRIKKIGINNYKPIEDSNISSDELAQDRADYELDKISILSQAVNVNSTYMIHLDVNNCIETTDSYFDFEKTRLIIQSLNIPLSTGSVIAIKCANIATLPFYSSSN